MELPMELSSTAYETAVQRQEIGLGPMYGEDFRLYTMLRMLFLQILQFIDNILSYALDLISRLLKLLI